MSSDDSFGITYSFIPFSPTMSPQMNATAIVTTAVPHRARNATEVDGYKINKDDVVCPSVHIRAMNYLSN